MTHTATFSHKITIDVDKLIELTKHHKVTKRSLIKLRADDLDRTRRSGFTHKRYMNTDITIPVLITDDNFVIDGRHRLCRLFDLGRRYVKVKVVSEKEIYQCRIE